MRHREFESHISVSLFLHLCSSMNVYSITRRLFTPCFFSPSFDRLSAHPPFNLTALHVPLNIILLEARGHTQLKLWTDFILLGCCTVSGISGYQRYKPCLPGRIICRVGDYMLHVISLQLQWMTTETWQQNKRYGLHSYCKIFHSYDWQRSSFYTACLSLSVRWGDWYHFDVSMWVWSYRASCSNSRTTDSVQCRK